MTDFNNDKTLPKRGPYKHFDDKDRTQIVRYIADHEIVLISRHMEVCHAAQEASALHHEYIDKQT